MLTLTVLSWIEFTAPVSTMEKMLDTTYNFYQPADASLNAKAIPRTTKYSVPQGLHEMIGMITPTTAFYNPVRGQAEPVMAKQQRSAAASCQTAITPACIKSLYDVDYTSKGNALVASTLLIGLAGSHSDYAKFGQAYVPGLKDFKDVSVSGGSNPGSGSNDILTEGNLDTQVRSIPSVSTSYMHI